MCVAYLAISEKPANQAFISGKTGILLNVLTYPQHRRQGITTKVILKIIEASKFCGVLSIDLFATNDGESLYKKIGFHESKYTTMRLQLD